MSERLEPLSGSKRAREEEEGRAEEDEYHSNDFFSDDYHSRKMREWNGVQSYYHFAMAIPLKGFLFPRLGSTWKRVGREIPTTEDSIPDLTTDLEEGGQEFHSGELETFHLKTRRKECFIKVGDEYFEQVVDIKESFLEHKRQLIADGYQFDTYHVDRSLFERLDRQLFCYTKPHRWGVEVLQELRNMLTQINTGSKPKRNEFSMLVMMDTAYVTHVANLILLLTNDKATFEDLNLFWQLTDRIWCFGHPTRPYGEYDLNETCEKIATRLEQVTSSSAE